MCAGIIGAGVVINPVAAQAEEVQPDINMAQLVEEAGENNASGSSGSSDRDEPLMVGLSSAAVIGAALTGGGWAVQQGLIPNPLPGILPSPAPVRQTPVPASAAEPTPVLYNCYMENAQVRPEAIILFCGDAHSILDQITWHSWTSKEASGQALLKEKTCIPDCAAGGYTARWVDFTLGGVVWNANEPEFTLALIEGKVYRIGQKPNWR